MNSRNRKVSEKEILMFIKKYRKKNGFSPTYKEIGDAMGLSDAGAFDAVKRLENEGYVKRDRRPRMMKVL